MTIVHVEAGGGRVRIASAGNVGAMLVEHREERRLGGVSATLGLPGPRPGRVHSDELPLRPREMLILHSDGISSRATLDGERDLLFQHPAAIAEHLVNAFGRSTDDALVLVVR